MISVALHSGARGDGVALEPARATEYPHPAESSPTPDGAAAMGMIRTRLAVLAALVVFAGQAFAQDTIGPEPGYTEAAEALSKLIDHEVEAKGLPAVSIALVADGKIVWSHGFGFADPKAKTPATAETVYRVGSVSKLFTDLALMQLLEEGKVDLDTPVKTYLPTFDVKNPTDMPITLRQLMSHRSGITREPPVGHYFDPTSPSLADTVASLNSTEIVYAPTAKTKYSNAGVAVVGQVVAVLRGQSFDDAVKLSVLDRIGMARSDFRLTPELAKSLAKAEMWTYDGRKFEAPTFGLGTSSAGNLYSTVNDLGKFLITLTKDGDAPGGRIVKPETLRAMSKPQFAAPDQSNGFGLGFMVSRFEGTKRIGHSGAVYGFATDVEFLPDEKLGVAVVASKDCANGVAQRIAEDGLRMLMAVKSKKPLPELPTTKPVEPELRDRAAWGGFANRGRSQAKPFVRFGALIDPRGSKGSGGMDLELRQLGDELVHDGPFAVNLSDRLRPVSQTDALKARIKEESAGSPPPAPPKSFDGLIGEYGWDHNILYVFEDRGKLQALIEWFFYYDLNASDDPDRFKFDDTGLYLGERAVFKRDDSGRATQVMIGDVVFPRRALAGEDGKTFQVKPTRPVAELQAEALKAVPPKEDGDFLTPELVDLTPLNKTIKLDIRYAGDNNFLGAPFYSSARALMQKPAAEALARAHGELKNNGLGLLIHDAYRPWYVTRMFWDGTEEANHNFVANPSTGSRHNRGCAVDLSLYDLKTGEPIQMVGGYDEFSDRSNPFYPGGTARQRWYRDRLRLAMEAQGFTVNEIEWWHFDFKDWARYPIGNSRFEDLK